VSVWLWYVSLNTTWVRLEILIVAGDVDLYHEIDWRRYLYNYFSIWVWERADKGQSISSTACIKIKKIAKRPTSPFFSR
jgi:hypothetical protein